MNITYNSATEAKSNIITFSDIPNILKVTADADGTKASVTLTFNSSLYNSTTKDNQWHITFMDETITNALTPENAVNKYFYVSTSPSNTAVSAALALRNCPTISANFIIQNSGSSVLLTAKKTGQMFQNGISVETDISSSDMTKSATDGTMFDEDAQLLNNSIVAADIFNNGEYVTTLRKNWYNGEVAFNLSPVLTTFSVYGNAVPYSVSLSSWKNGSATTLGNISTNYASIGYMCNQGYKFLDNDVMNIAQNYSRGTEKDTDNNTLLYVYQPSIPISFYKGNSGGMTIITEYKDSAFNTFYSATTTWQSTSSERRLIDMEIPLHQQLLYQAFYIDLTMGVYTIRYNVIKPLKMTEYSQRIYWRNSYGGVSFFDFTGQKTETRDFEISTYQKSIYDYYEDPMNELNKIYDNDVKYIVTLKSHLFENDGKFIFNDIIQSPLVWTEINGEKYAIILRSVSVEETDNNNVFEATISYNYSMNPSII